MACGMTYGNPFKIYYQEVLGLWEGQQRTTASLWKQFYYRYRAGIPWTDLPQRFGDFPVVHTRFSRWSRSGVIERVFQALAEDADNEYAMIDATIARAHQHSAGAKNSSAQHRRYWS